MNTFQFRLIDTAGSELSIIASEVAEVAAGDTVQTPDGRRVEVVEVYDDEFGQEGGVAATLVVDNGTDTQNEQAPAESAAALLDLIDQLGLGSQRDEIARWPHSCAIHRPSGSIAAIKDRSRVAKNLGRVIPAASINRRGSSGG